ncbi:TPA: RES family NAD+ phosphorylase [Elizabethkingia anophelis]
MKTIACSECFKDEGLRLTCERHGNKNKKKCPNCSNFGGYKLSEENLRSVCDEYFIRGSFLKTEFGGASLINFNEAKKTRVKFIKYIKQDIKLIEKKLGYGFFMYAPPMHNLGFTEPFEHMENRSIKGQNKILEEIVTRYSTVKINDKDCFYRLRVNPEFPYKRLQYDSPPIKMSGKGRLDTKRLNILYASPNIEACLHECRATLVDNLYIAKMVPCKELKLLNLSSGINDNRLEFENLDIFINHIFTSENQSYKFCRKIARYAYNKGYDGIIYPSYFNQVKSEKITNYALFGSPILRGKVEIKSIDRLLINEVDYKYGFGPVVYD